MAHIDDELIHSFHELGFRCKWYGFGQVVIHKLNLNIPTADYEKILPNGEMLTISISPEWVYKPIRECGVKGVNAYIHRQGSYKTKPYMVKDVPLMKELCERQFRRMEELGTFPYRPYYVDKEIKDGKAD